VDFVVDREGKVQNPVAVAATHPDLAAAAVEAVRRWTFDPGQKGGRAVNTHVQVPIVFSISNDSGAARPGTWF